MSQASDRVLPTEALGRLIEYVGEKLSLELEAILKHMLAEMLDKRVKLEKIGVGHF